VKRYALLPFHSTPLLLVGTFSLGLLLASKAGLMGIPLAFILLSWFFKYCFVVLDAIVAGDEEPPVLSIEMVNPVGEQRPLVLALLILVECMLVIAVRKYAGTPASVLAIGVLTVALPANIAVLGVTRNPFLAASPHTLFQIVRALGRDYVLLNVTMLGAAAIIYCMGVYEAPLWLALAAMQLLFLTTFALVGGAVFEHRLELGIDSRTRQERAAERDAREHQVQRGRMLDRAYSKFRVSKPLEGWQEIEAWLREFAQGERQMGEYRALLAAASKWDDARVGDRLANDVLALLLAKRATGEALDVVEQRIVTNPQFQLSQPAQAMRLAELAGAAGKRALQRRLMPKA
jgi:hypothetical protein